MIINTFITDADWLFSPKTLVLIRKHGPDFISIEYLARAICHSMDGEPVDYKEVIEMLQFYSGLDCEQVERCLNILFENSLLQKTDENLIFSERVKSDLQEVKNKREIYRKNIEKRWKKSKENKPLNTTVLQSNYNSNTNHQNQNQNQNTEPEPELRSKTNKKDLKMISIQKFQEEGKIQSKKFQNLWFSRDEFEKLKNNYGQEEMVTALDILNAYPESSQAANKKFWSYLSHYRTVIGWPLDEARRKLKITLDLQATEKRLEFYNK